MGRFQIEGFRHIKLNCKKEMTKTNAFQITPCIYGHFKCITSSYFKYIESNSFKFSLIANLILFSSSSFLSVLKYMNVHLSFSVHDIRYGSFIPKKLIS